jgi:DNA-directed RNA polymerase specialized sigma24 family protein
MTNSRRPLILLRDYLARLSRTTEGDLALARFAEAGLDLDGAGDLCTLVHRRGRTVGGLRRARLLDTLSPLACTDEVAALCVVVSLRPELTRMARLLARGPLDHEEAESEMVAIAWELVTTRHCNGTGPPRPEALVNAMWTEARRSAGLRRRGLIDIVPLVPDLDVAAPEDDPLERWPGLLAAAVARGVLTPGQLVLIARTRMEGRPLTEVAATLGRPYGTVKLERWRAEAALREFALGFSSERSQ